MLDKGKVPLLHKLRTIQLIEGDLQLLMRVLISQKNAPRAKASIRLSGFNFGNFKNHDITTAFLENQLIKDVSNTTNSPIL